MPPISSLSASLPLRKLQKKAMSFNAEISFWQEMRGISFHFLADKQPRFIAYLTSAPPRTYLIMI
jgi:hypothetical protein